MKVECKLKPGVFCEPKGKVSLAKLSERSMCIGCPDVFVSDIDLVRQSASAVGRAYPTLPAATTGVC